MLACEAEVDKYEQDIRRISVNEGNEVSRMPANIVNYRKHLYLENYILKKNILSGPCLETDLTTRHPRWLS